MAQGCVFAPAFAPTGLHEGVLLPNDTRHGRLASLVVVEAEWLAGDRGVPKKRAIADLGAMRTRSWDGQTHRTSRLTLTMDRDECTYVSLINAGACLIYSSDSLPMMAT